MQIRSILSMMLCLMLATAIVSAQTEQTLKRMARGKMDVSPDELVSFKADVQLPDALSSLAELSKKLDGKIVIDRLADKDKAKQIGVNIDGMYWKDALELILRNNQLWYNEYPEYREIVTLAEIGKAAQTAPTGARDAARPAGAPAATAAQPEVVDSSEIYAKLREITISSIFFEVNQTKLSQVGARFSIFRGRDLNLGIEFDGTKKIETPIFGASLSPTNPKLAVDINAGLSLIESNQLGEVIARPQVTVRSTASARIQVGTDFSTREKDFSGNIVEKFYSTGTILTVRPKVYSVGDVEFIDLQYSIERSTVTPGEVTTLINKTLASGSLSLLNGEESYVGGMFSNEEIVLREGVPFLKDLPWWVFGLRYLFGYDSKQINRKELIVLLKGEMLPLVEERAARPSRKDMMQERLRENQQEFEKRSRLNKEKP